MPLFIFLNTQTMQIKSNIRTPQHCYDLPKNLIPWRDSNPGLQHVLNVYAVIFRYVSYIRVLKAHWLIQNNFGYSEKYI
jgi:hypothetical protein